MDWCDPMPHEPVPAGPYANARVQTIDTAPTRNISGVIAAYTAADLTYVSLIAGGLGCPRPERIAITTSSILQFNPAIRSSSSTRTPPNY
jgi:hypothetical protein